MQRPLKRISARSECSSGSRCTASLDAQSTFVYTDDNGTFKILFPPSPFYLHHTEP